VELWAARGRPHPGVSAWGVADRLPSVEGGAMRRCASGGPCGMVSVSQALERSYAGPRAVSRPFPYSKFADMVR
jgi:hypothetical protein